MEALSTSMGVCGSVGAGLGASANVPSINFCSESLSTVATPCIYRKKKKEKRREEKKERQKLTEEVRRKAENERHEDIMWRARVAAGQNFTQSFTSIWGVMRTRSEKHFQKLYVLMQDGEQSNLKVFWGFVNEGERLLTWVFSPVSADHSTLQSERMSFKEQFTQKLKLCHQHHLPCDDGTHEVKCKKTTKKTILLVWFNLSLQKPGDSKYWFEKTLFTPLMCGWACTPEHF